MNLQLITEKQKAQYKKLVNHIMQSWEWGQFRKAVGTKLLRFGTYQNNKLSKVFQLTLHQIPFTKKYVGYLPKGPFPDKELAEDLTKISKDYNCAFIKVEPDIEISNIKYQIYNLFKKSPKSLFTRYNFILDLTKSEDQLLKDMHPKTRYNIKVAQKHGVKVEERVDDEAFKIYSKLYFETCVRQGYYGHNEQYHRKVWEILKANNMARLLIAFYRPSGSDIRHPTTAWLLLNFKDTLYYPYGGSSKAYQQVMANNLVAWEAIKLGKKLNLKRFDMWGALGPNANTKNPWYGFHRFKQGYGGQLVEYIGTYDLVFDWPIYILFTAIDKLTLVKIYLLKLLNK
ncbi:peptidoglycan bridge formation glycyltransferase FemA/FemB family protein [Candidatus Daviesbacteria bacterium]|nr:peptidoglycan bridge formation glycyltransferase FemA/FemB family protein [Candidatus Daviesbacteria bacterium]MBI4038816.1 peptidoglycan bridge formation glycyltransferase FemA/FemB family protein [Candidatus Daviesbacteria bacterium]